MSKLRTLGYRLVPKRHMIRFVFKFYVFVFCFLFLFLFIYLFYLFCLFVLSILFVWMDGEC